jgi:hypothetical protein
MLETMSSFAASNRQSKILKEWNKTKGYIVKRLINSEAKHQTVQKTSASVRRIQTGSPESQRVTRLDAIDHRYKEKAQSRRHKSPRQLEFV